LIFRLSKWISSGPILWESERASWSRCRRSQFCPADHRLAARLEQMPKFLSAFALSDSLKELRRALSQCGTAGSAVVPDSVRILFNILPWLKN